MQFNNLQIRPLKRILVCLFLLQFIVTPLFGQDVVMRNFTADDGLPSNETFHILQDSKGYIWIATDRGVSRYDGFEFVNFGVDKGLPSNTILNIVEDYKGRIWFVSLSCRLSYFENDSIHVYKYNDKLIKAFKKSPIPMKGGFYVSTNDDVYLSVGKIGIIKVDKNGDLKIFPGSPDIKNVIFDIEDYTLMLPYTNNDKKFWFYQDDQLIKTMDNVIGFDPNSGFSQIKRKGLFDYYFTSAHKVFHIKDSAISLIQSHEFSVIEYQVDEDGCVWMGFDSDGVKKYDCDLKEEKLHLLKDLSVSCYLKDQHDGHWFATLEAGVFYAPNLKFKTFKGENYAHHIKSVVRIGGELYVLEHINKIHHVNQSKEIALKGKREYIYCSDSLDGNLLIGTSEGLYRYDPDKGELKWLPIEDYASKSAIAGIKSLHISDDGTFYIGTASNLMRSVKVAGDTVYTKVVTSFRTSCLTPDYTGESLWLGSLYGLYQYVIESDSLVYHGEFSDYLQSRILEIYVNENNTLYCGTKGSGVIKYCPQKREVDVITTKQGLSSNYINAFMVQDSLLWIGTINGVNIINLYDKRIPVKQITKTDGIPSNFINDICQIDSTIYISTSHGVGFFNLDNIQQPKQPQVVINKVSSTEIEKVGDTYLIPYPYQLVRFKYTLFTYNNEEELMIKYRVKGLSDTWQYTTSNEVFFPYLPMGKYVFEIAAKNKSGEWGELTLVPFVIETPFWRAVWFYALVVVFLLFGISSMLLLAISNKRIKDDARRKIVKYQQQALSNQMNPHFLFNSLNSIHRYLLESKPIFASKYLSKFARLMRLVLNNSSQEYITIKQEIEGLKLYLELESLRMKNAFTFDIYVDQSLKSDKYLIPSMLIQPLVENAVIHGVRYLTDKPGRIEVHFSNVNNYIQISVDDNGVGRSRAAEIEQKVPGDSKGSSIIHKRIELLNQLYNSKISLKYLDLYQNDSVAQGTRVIVFQLPIKQI